MAWLGKINFVTSLFYIGALILPYALVQGPDTFDKSAPVNESADWKEAINCSDTYISELQSYIANRSSFDQKAIDILQGTVIFRIFKFWWSFDISAIFCIFPFLRDLWRKQRLSSLVRILIKFCGSPLKILMYATTLPSPSTSAFGSLLALLWLWRFLCEYFWQLFLFQFYSHFFNLKRWILLLLTCK